MSTDGLFTARESAIIKPAMKPAEKRRDHSETQSPLDLAGIDINDADELRKLVKQELLYVIKANRGALGVVTALRELLDRIDGKPAQSVNMEATVKQVTVNAIIRFAGNVQLPVDNVFGIPVDKPQVIENEG